MRHDVVLECEIGGWNISADNVSECIGNMYKLFADLKDNDTSRNVYLFLPAKLM